MKVVVLCANRTPRQLDQMIEMFNNGSKHILDVINRIDDLPQEEQALEILSAVATMQYNIKKYSAILKAKYLMPNDFE